MCKNRWLKMLLGATGIVVLVAAARYLYVMSGNWYFGLRCPYLQMAGPSSLTVRWMTEKPEIGQVRIGYSPNALHLSVSEQSPVRDHRVGLRLLSPDTKYYYSVGTKESTDYGGNEDYWFVTSPAPGQAKSTRILVFGDSGKEPEESPPVRDGVLRWLGDHRRPNRPYADLWLILGDVAAKSGRNIDLQSALFNVYPTLLRTLPLWPALGNHDDRRNAYFKVFDLPQRGECGGLPSGTEHYYSFDYGLIHIVCLDSEASSLRPRGRMMNWLQYDLMATHQPWLLVFFHHPPYTRGNHNSDDSIDSGGRMQAMRRVFLPVLEKGGADLVMTGHSHVYERSFLLDGHYGPSDSLAESMILDRGDGRPDGAGAYHKKTHGLSPHEGTVYMVMGSTSHADKSPLNHPVMYTGQRRTGAVVIDIEGNMLTSRFISKESEVLDTFSIVKGDPNP